MSRGRVLALTIVLAACSLLYELVAAQTLAVLAANTVVWYSLVVGVFLGAMGLGASFGHRPADPLQALIRVELGLVAIGAVVVPALHGGHSAYTALSIADQNVLGGLVFCGIAGIVVSAVGVLTGLELPLLMRLAPGDDADSDVLGFDYLGAVLAGVAFPLLLLPSLSLLQVAIGVAAINLTAAVWLGDRAVSGVLALGLAGLGLGSPQIDQTLLQAYYAHYRSITHPGYTGPPPTITRHRSPYQTIDLWQEVDGPTTGLIHAYSDKPPTDGWVLALNGDFQTNTRHEEVYHEWFAHIPIVLTDVPARVLVLGGGDGFLLREILEHPVSSVDFVDLDTGLVELARTHPVLTAHNRGAFDDPRVTVHHADAFVWLRTATSTYDAVYIDFPRPNTYDLAKLYSQEFYARLLPRVATDGFVVQTATGSEDLDGDGRAALDSDWFVFRDTLRAGGFETVTAYVSRLESDNPAALDLADADVVEDYLLLVRQGYILAFPERRELRPTWRDPGVRLHVLNAERFALAWADFRADVPPEPHRVNSILRPTLPTTPWWEPRSGY